MLSVVGDGRVSFLRSFICRSIFFIIIIFFGSGLLLRGKLALVVFEALAFCGIIEDDGVHHLERTTLVLHHSVDRNVCAA
jgi:hypothetical protein